MVTRLTSGQGATVLQLPVSSERVDAKESTQHDLVEPAKTPSNGR
jgi:hypothetical protein